MSGGCFDASDGGQGRKRERWKVTVEGKDGTHRDSLGFATKVSLEIASLARSTQTIMNEKC